MSDVFQLGGVEVKSGEKNGKTWTMWKLKDVNNQDIGATFQAPVGQAAQNLIRQTVEVDREHGDRGYKVTAIRPAAQGAAPTVPAPATPTEYQRPRTPDESGRITRLACLKAASQLCAGSGDFQKVISIARAFEEFANTGDSVPF